MSLVVQQLSTATLGGITAAMHAPLFPTEHLGKVHTHTTQVKNIHQIQGSNLMSLTLTSSTTHKT